MNKDASYCEWVFQSGRQVARYHKFSPDQILNKKVQVTGLKSNIL